MNKEEKGKKKIFRRRILKGNDKENVHRIRETKIASESYEKENIKIRER